MGLVELQMQQVGLMGGGGRRRLITLIKPFTRPMLEDRVQQSPTGRLLDKLEPKLKASHGGWESWAKDSANRR